LFPFRCGSNRPTSSPAARGLEFSPATAELDVFYKNKPAEVIEQITYLLFIKRLDVAIKNDPAPAMFHRFQRCEILGSIREAAVA
jgi:hypothetical protein